MINSFIKAYQQYNAIRCYFYKKLFEHFYVKCYSNLYKEDDEGIKYFSKKNKKGIKDLIKNHLRDDTCVIMDKLEDYIY